MVSVKSVRSALGLSNIHLSNKFSKVQKRSIQNSDLYEELDKLAGIKGVDVKFKPINKGSQYTDFAIMTKSRYEHITDIQDYAVKHDTGDSVYIAVKPERLNPESPINTISSSVKAAFDFLSGAKL